MITWRREGQMTIHKNCGGRVVYKPLAYPWLQCCVSNVCERCNRPVPVSECKSEEEDET